MKSLIKTTIKRPIAVCMLVVILLATGVLATLDMSTNLLPNISLPIMGVTVTYPGASAQSVEDNVTIPLENALQTVSGIEELETTSYDNVSVAVLTFDYGTDLDKKIDAIEESLQSVTFPEGCSDPAYIKVDMNGTATATVAMFNSEQNQTLLEQNAQQLATKLRAVEGVGSVDVFGTAENQIKITSLNGLDIASLAIVQSLSAEGLNIPLGTVMQDGTIVSIRNVSDAASLLDVMQLPAKVDLGSGAMSAFSSLKSGVKMFVTSTRREFDDYVQNARDALNAIHNIEGKSAAQLEEDRDNLAAVKSLMSLVRDSGSSTTLKWLGDDLFAYLDRHGDDFVNLSESDLQTLSDSLGISVEALKWTQDRYADGTLRSDWESLVEFRRLFPDSDTNGDGKLDGQDITYDQFATLFQDGGQLNGTPYNGLDLLHSQQKHAAEDVPCERETYTHAQAVDLCKFADSVNTVAYNDIIDTVRSAEDKQNQGETVEQPVISDAQFAALFVNSEQSKDFPVLMSSTVIHIIRQPNFDNGENSIVNVLTKSKIDHTNSDGNPVFKNGKVLTKNDDGDFLVTIEGKEFVVNNSGRLTDSQGNIVNEAGTVLTFDDDQKIQNYLNLGSYIVYTDDELLQLYNSLQTDADFAVTPTLDTIRFVRLCDFAPDGQQLVVPLTYLGHIEKHKDTQSFARYNNMSAVTIKVYAVSDANTTKVVENVRTLLHQNQTESTALLLDDKAQFINESIRNVLSSILIGGGLAIVIIYLFVRKVRSSLVVAITMPLSVLVALLGLWAMDITLNMVSLGGLAVGIGMLVDNSIVVLESITKRRDAGENIFDSCLYGTSEVAGSLLASTLTNICVFFPILFAGGLTREIFYDLVWAVIYSIAMSLIVAVSVIPSLYHLVYKTSPRPRYKKVNGQKVLVGSFEQNEPRSDIPTLLDGSPAVEVKNDSKNSAEQTQSAQNNGENTAEKRTLWQRWHNPRGIHKMENVYGNILQKVLKKRVWVCVVALVVFASSIGLVFTTGTEFMPSVDKGIVEVNLSFDSASTAEENNLVGTTAAELIANHYGEGVQYVSLTIGKQSILSVNPTGVLRIQLDKSRLNTSQTTQEIRTLLKDANLNAKFISVREVDGVVAEVTGGMASQSVTLMCEDSQQLAKVAAIVAEKLQSVENIASVTDNTPQKTQQISFAFDKELCAKSGVDYQNAVLMLRVGLSGHTAATLTIDGEQTDAVVTFDPQTQNSLDQLLNAVVGFGNDKAVVLSDVLKKQSDGTPYTSQLVDSVISRKDGKYVTTIDVESYGVDTGTLSSRISAVVSEVLAENPSVIFEEGGVASYLTDAFNGLAISLIAAFLLLYGVMACQFESLQKPFIVIASIPLSFTGGFLALVITGTTLNVVSFVGLIMLMGVIVNDAIVLIDKINMLIADGVQPQQAVVLAGKSRLRPILMTTLTTVLALVPLALGLGSGGELMQPMGIVVIGGLTLGTLVTLVLIPSFYCIIKRISFNTDQGEKSKRHKRRKQTDALPEVNSESAESHDEQSSIED